MSREPNCSSTAASTPFRPWLFQPSSLRRMSGWRIRHHGPETSCRVARDCDGQRRRRAERLVSVLSAFTARGIDTALHGDERRAPRPCQPASAVHERVLGTVVHTCDRDPRRPRDGSGCRGIRRSRARIVARQDMGTRVRSHRQITPCRGPLLLTRRDSGYEHPDAGCITKQQRRPT
jgi:hypothetical protein